jgi:hypothetical protein
MNACIQGVVWTCFHFLLGVCLPMEFLCHMATPFNSEALPDCLPKWPSVLRQQLSMRVRISLPPPSTGYCLSVHYTVLVCVKWYL